MPLEPPIPLLILLPLLPSRLHFLCFIFCVTTTSLSCQAPTTLDLLVCTHSAMMVGPLGPNPCPPMATAPSWQMGPLCTLSEGRGHGYSSTKQGAHRHIYWTVSRSIEGMGFRGLLFSHCILDGNHLMAALAVGVVRSCECEFHLASWFRSHGSHSHEPWCRWCTLATIRYPKPQSRGKKKQKRGFDQPAGHHDGP